tara:strand:- start:675 stop:1214 length:540 start_codon:yes stop_codon:yes gene_type:complete
MKIDKNKTKEYITQKQLPIMEKENGLEICYRTANLLKEQFPNEIMKITPTTIIEHSVKNSRLLGGKKGRRGGMSGCQAYYTIEKPHRIVVKQQVLISQEHCWCGANHYSVDPIMQKYGHSIVPKRSLNTPIRGNFALVELMCHELAHHRTKGHAKGFKIKYKRHLDYMVNKIISGEFYQ